MIYSKKPNEFGNARIVSESTSSEGRTEDSIKLEGINLVDYLGCDPDYINESSETENNDTYHNPVAMEAFTKYLNINDTKTRKTILAMNEADQGTVLTSLTSKLYDNIVSKVDDIDYGDIPSTKGDITKLANYEKLKECIDLMKGILKEYKQDTTPIDEVALALSNVSTRKDLFNRAFRLDVELPIIMYNNTVLSIISAVSYMIATCIEFIKTPNQDTFQITLDKVAYAKTKHNMLYNNLKRFNKSCAKGDVDKAMEFIIKNRVGKAMHEAIGIAATVVIGTVGIILSIIPILREMVFFFYYTRMRVSEFFDIQADLLQMNAYNVENSETMDEDKKKHIVSKQLKIVEFIRKMSNKIAIEVKNAEVESDKEISTSSKKINLNDLDISDNISSALF